MIHVVALLARAGHGKTTAANYLRDTYGVSIVSLAAPLKKIAKVVMGFSDAQLYGTQEEKESRVLPCPGLENGPEYGAIRDARGEVMSARVFLQKLGTEGIRQNLGPLTWCEALRYNIAQDAAARGYDGSGTGPGVPATDLVYVVDDARFINEVEFVKRLTDRDGLPKFFGTTIKLVCTDAPPSGNDNHPSEAEVDRIPANLIDAVATSSRAQGTEHLIEQVEAALALDHMANLRGALNRSAMARAAAERTEQLNALVRRASAA
jgi:hypothetical protein